MSGHTVLPFLFLSAAVEAQHLNVFLTQHNITDDKKATVSQPLIRIEDIEGYSICFREPTQSKMFPALSGPSCHIIIIIFSYVRHLQKKTSTLTACPSDTFSSR